MATENVLYWLEQDGWPLDLYDLFGRWIFDPDLDAMRSEVALAARELLPYQSHTNPHTAQRAMKLLTEHVGRASVVLSNPQKLQDENARILSTLRQQFARTHGDRTDGWDPETLFNWLVAEARVHPAAAEDTRDSLLGVEKRKRTSVFGAPAAVSDVEDTYFVAQPEQDEPVARPAGPPPLVRGVHIKEKTCPMCGTRVLARDNECSNCAYDFTASRSDARLSTIASAAAPLQPRMHIRGSAPAASNPGKIVAIVAAAVAVPLALLVGVVIWIVSGNNDESSNDDGENPAGVNRIVSNDPDENGKTDLAKTPVNGNGKTVVVRKADPEPKPVHPKPAPVKPSGPLTKRTLTPAVAGLGFAHWKKKGIDAKGGPDELDALLNALALATSDDDRAEIFAFLAYNEPFLANAKFEDLQRGIDALSKSTRHYSRIARLAAKLGSEKDVLSLINLYVSRLQRSSFDRAARRALQSILASADAMKQLSLENLVASYERAHRYLSTYQSSVANSLARVLEQKGDLQAALKRAAAGLSSFTGDKAAADLTAAVLTRIAGNDKRYAQIPRDDIFAAYSGVIRAVSTYSRATHAGNVLRFADGDGSTARALTYFRGLYRKNANDPAALAVLTRHANDEYDKARRLSGFRKVTAINAAVDLAPTPLAKQLLLSRASSDSEYMRLVGFDRGLEIHEALVARYLPPNPHLKYSAAREARRLITFVESKGKTATLHTRYRNRLKVNPKDALARELYDTLAAATAEDYSKTIRFTWTSSNYTEMDRRLKDFDNEARTAAHAVLIADYRFKRGLTTAKYLAMHEEIIGAASEAERPARIISLVLDVPYGMPMPSTSSSRTKPRRSTTSRKRKPTVYVSTSVARWDAAVKYFRGRTRQNNIVSIPNLYALHGLLKKRVTRSYYYHPTTYPKDVASDRKEMDALATKIRQLTGKSP